MLLDQTTNISHIFSDCVVRICVRVWDALIQSGRLSKPVCVHFAVQHHSTLINSSLRSPKITLIASVLVRRQGVVRESVRGSLQCLQTKVTL